MTEDTVPVSEPFTTGFKLELTDMPGGGVQVMANFLAGHGVEKPEDVPPSFVLGQLVLTYLETLASEKRTVN